MSTILHRSKLSTRPGNISETERWLSLIAGAGLALSTLRRGGLLSKLLGGAAAFSLISRGSTGYCAMKAALEGKTSLRDGIREQFERTTAQIASATVREINDMQQLYSVELQELHSAETQLISLLESLGPSVQSSALALRFDEYLAELRSRKADLDNLLAEYHVDANAHRDDAMRSLIKETMKMSRVCAAELRDAALAASVQRIIHYKIASYGTIAAYAKSLGHLEEAKRFADAADRDRTIDGELTELAKSALNPSAAAQLEPGVTTQESGAGLRPH
jgi:ferritin-like metal-binding protein YciE